MARHSDPTALRDRNKLFRALPDTVRDAVLEDRHWLVVHFGTELRSYRLDDDSELVIGRAGEAHVIVPDISVSRRHARVTCSAGAVRVEDLGSSNGTFVQGEPVRGEIQVAPGVEIAIGEARAWVLSSLPAVAAFEGLEPHARMLQRIADEIARSRTFGRPFGLMMLRAPDRPSALLSDVMPRLRALLRPADRVALFSHSMLEVLVPESSPAELDALGRQVVTGIAEVAGLRIDVGTAFFPDSGVTAEELVEKALGALGRDRGSPARGLESEGGSGGSPRRGGTEPVCVNARMREIYALAAQLALRPIPVLICGETGVGKELVARAIHAGGPDRDAPMLSVNCAAIPEQLVQSVLFGHERGAFTGADQTRVGVLEAASGGTLFLDEVGDLAAEAQAALLRVLETGRMLRVGGTTEITVDARVISATNRPLDEMTRLGMFRADLLYRLNTVVVAVPPLRERLDEVIPLAHHFLAEASRKYATTAAELTTEAATLLLSYDWPGNVRELRNVIEHAAINAHGSSIVPGHLADRLHGEVARPPAPLAEPATLSDGGSFRDRVRAFERHLIVMALERNAWNQSSAARELRIPLRTLTHKLRHYGIQKP